MDQLEITSRFRICNKMKLNEIEHLFSKMTNSPRDEAARPSKAGQPKKTAVGCCLGVNDIKLAL